MWTSRGVSIMSHCISFFQCTIWQDCQHHLLLKCWWWECECCLSWLRVKGCGGFINSTAYPPALHCSPMPTCLRYATRTGSSNSMMRKKMRRKAKAQQSQMANMVPGRAASQWGHPMQASLLVSGESPSILLSLLLGVVRTLKHIHVSEWLLTHTNELDWGWSAWEKSVSCMLVGWFQSQVVETQFQLIKLGTEWRRLHHSTVLLSSDGTTHKFPFLLFLEWQMKPLSN